MGEPKEAGKVKKSKGTLYKTKALFADTALDPNHIHYWGCKRFNQKTIVLRCMVCGHEERRKIDRKKIPHGEVPDITISKRS